MAVYFCALSFLDDLTPYDRKYIPLDSLPRWSMVGWYQPLHGGCASSSLECAGCNGRNEYRSFRGDGPAKHSGDCLHRGRADFEVSSRGRRRRLVSGSFRRSPCCAAQTLARRILPTLGASHFGADSPSACPFFCRRGRGRDLDIHLKGEGEASAFWRPPHLRSAERRLKFPRHLNPKMEDPPPDDQAGRIRAPTMGGPWGR